MASYRVQVWNFDSDFSTNNLIAEFENPKNLGYGSYLNDIGEAFFTINQRDAKANIRASEGKAHLFIIRYGEGNEDVVWRGIMGEHDAIDEDVIFYAYGYEHYFFTIHTGWKKKWRQTQIAGADGRPVDYLWTRATTGQNDSPLQWVTKGTLESPWTTDAQDTALVLNRYQVNWKPIHRALKELTAIATSDTRNMCFYEIDFPTDPTDHSATFNFWRDNSTDQNDLRLEYPNNILDWSDRYTPVLKRNKTFGVGKGPRGQLYRYQWGQGKSPFGRLQFGMHSQNLYLSWVRDRAELGRIVKRRTQLGLREDTDVWVRCHPGTVPPWRSTSATWHLGDTVWTKIQHGSTNISKRMYLMGEQVVFANGREYVQPMLEDRYGSFSSTFAGWEFLGSTNSTNGSGGVPWLLYPEKRGTFSESRTVTLPEDTQVAVACVISYDYSGYGTDFANYNATLNGVAGTKVSTYTSGQTGAAMFAWVGSQVPSGSSVALVLNKTGGYSNDIDHAVAWGLAVAGSGADTPTAIEATTFNGGGAGGTPEVTLDSGVVSGMGLMFGELSTSQNLTPNAASERIAGLTALQGGLHKYFVFGSISATTGETTIGASNGGTVSGGVGPAVIFSNAEGL
jgi:hypothetical protein